MYPHVTQFETRDARLRDRSRLDADRRAAARRRDGGAQVTLRTSRIRALAAALLRTS